MDLETLLNQYSAGVREFNGKDLRHVDLHGLNLSYTCFRNCDLRGVDLRGTNLKGTDLREANLSLADLSWVDLQGADLRGCDLTGANLIGANLDGAKVSGSALRQAIVQPHQRQQEAPVSRVGSGFRPDRGANSRSTPAIAPVHPRDPVGTVQKG